MRFHSCVFATEVGAAFLYAIQITPPAAKIKAFFDDIRQGRPELQSSRDLPKLDLWNRFEAKLRLTLSAGTQAGNVQAAHFPRRQPGSQPIRPLPFHDVEAA